MRRFTYAAATVACVLMLGAPPASAHNEGCVTTGNGDVITVGSGKSGPYVSENNPHWHVGTDDDRDGDPATTNQGRLDLADADIASSRGDQYGARFAADQGYSAVQAPPPGGCV